MADPYAGLVEEEDPYAGLAEPEPLPGPPPSRPAVLSPKADAFALSGAQAIPAGGLVADLMATGLARALRPDGTVDPAFLLAYPGLAAAARLAQPFVQSRGVEFTPEGAAAMEAQGTPVEEVPERGLVEDYREIRDTRKEREAQGRREEPRWAKAGATAGTLAAILTPGAPAVQVSLPARGAGVANRILSGAATGGLYGGATAATEGDADLTRGEVAKAVKQTAGGAAGGAAVGGTVGVAAELGRPLLVEPLRRFALNQGRRVLQGGSDLSGATRRPVSDEAVEEVLQSKAIRPFRTTQSTYERVDELAEAQGRQYGEIVEELEKRGVQGAQVPTLARALLKRGEEEARRTGSNKAASNVFSDEAANLQQVAEGRLRLPLSQGEAIKQDLQKQARYERLKSTATDETRQETASVLRQANEDSIEEAAKMAAPGSDIRALAERFVPVKQRTGRLLEARGAVERAASKAAQRNTIGLPEYAMMASTGEPLSGLGMALATNLGRNRLPSATTAGAYALSEGLRDGSLTPALARALSLIYEPDVRDTTSALVEYLRRKDTP